MLTADSSCFAGHTVSAGAESKVQLTQKVVSTIRIEYRFNKLDEEKKIIFILHNYLVFVNNKAEQLSSENNTYRLYI